MGHRRCCDGSTAIEPLTLKCPRFSCQPSSGLVFSQLNVAATFARSLRFVEWPVRLGCIQMCLAAKPHEE